MASGRLSSKNLREEMTDFGYTFDEMGRYALGVLPDYDDEGYIEKNIAFALGLTQELYEKLINDKLIATNEYALPKKRRIIIKYLNWLNDQTIYSNRFKESKLKRHWHDDTNRNDVLIEIKRRAEEDKARKLKKKEGVTLT